MPGTTYSAFGHPALTAIAAVILALFVVGALVAARRRISDRRVYSLAGGVGYAVVYVSWWWVIEMYYGTLIGNWIRSIENFLASVRGPVHAVAQINWIEFLGMLALFPAAPLAAFTLQGAVLLYAFARWRFRTTLAVLFVTSVIMGCLFGIAGGETPPILLFLWSLYGVPLSITATVALGAIEVAWRRYRGQSGRVETPGKYVS